MVERMYDTVMAVALPANTAYLKRVLQLRNNFPFALRQLELWSTGTNTTVRVRRVDGSYIESAALQRGTMFRAGVSDVNFVPIQPEVVYPAHGAIEVDWSNSLGVTDNVRLNFRGVQYVPELAAPAYVWPKRFTMSKFDYVTRDTIQNVETLLDRQLMVQRDADFLILGVTSAQNNAFDTPLDLRYRFKGEWGWAYSDVALERLSHIGNRTPADPRPFVPPIFVPRSASFYYDVVRNDPLGTPAEVMIRWIGYKITEVCS